MGARKKHPQKSKAKSTQKWRKFGLGVGWRFPSFVSLPWMDGYWSEIVAPRAQLGPVLQKKKPLAFVKNPYTLDS